MWLDVYSERAEVGNPRAKVGQDPRIRQLEFLGDFFVREPFVDKFLEIHHQYLQIDVITCGCAALHDPAGLRFVLLATGTDH